MNAFNFLVRVPGASLQSDVKERSLDLRELRYFHSVARTGNFGRSARDLNISQPAISHQLRKLEEGLGTQLLVRHGRGVMLTPAGACLRDRLDTVMQLLSSPLDEGTAGASVPGSLSLAIHAETGPLLVAQLANEFRARWPDVALDIREGSGTDLEEWVLHRRVDVAIMQDPPKLDELKVTPVLKESLGLVISVGSSAIGDSRPLRLRDLDGQSLILPSRQHWIRRRVAAAAQRYGLRLEPILQVDSVASTKAIVRNGLGCTILPLTAVQDEVARGVLAFRPIVHPELVSVCAIARHYATAAPIVATFADIAHQAMTALAQSGVWPGAQIIRSDQRPVVPMGAYPAETDSSETVAGRTAI
jgi:LysR family transcriptional regulator, nitrogen assimilation regulatory protein